MKKLALSTLAVFFVAYPLLDHLCQPELVHRNTAHASETDPSQATEVGHPTLVSPHASPIDLVGNLVFVVNTPADTVDVIH